MSGSENDDLVERILSGRAVLFAGSGFTNGAINIAGEPLGSAKTLAHDICDFGGFPRDDDLRYAAEFYLASQNQDASKLVPYLKKRFSVRNVEPHHEVISSVAWRRIYTTNYDHCIEQAARNAGVFLECICVDKPAEHVYRKDGLCIHINGSIDQLTERTIGKSFKLSASSYVSAQSFLDSTWGVHFKRDLERCSALIFVGYSLYDIEIQRVLFENPSFVEKTFFITDSSPDPKVKFTLSKYGSIHQIGVSGLADIISAAKTSGRWKSDDRELESLEKFEVSDDKVTVRDANVEILLRYGDIEASLVDAAVVGQQSIPYLVVRDQLDLIRKTCESGGHSIVIGGFGNGKSLLIRQICPFLTVNLPWSVYLISDDDRDYIADVDLLESRGEKFVVVIDGYDRYLDLVEHISKNRLNHVILIASSRLVDHERMRPSLKEFGFSFSEISCDELSDRESEEFVSIIDNVGLWGEKAGLSRRQKLTFVRRENDGQFSSSLLVLLDAPQIKERVAKVLEVVLGHGKYRDTVFAIALMQVIDIPVECSMVSEVAMNDEIYSSGLRQDPGFRQIFGIANGRVMPKSSLFCMTLIKGYFSPAYVGDQMQKIAKRFSGDRALRYSEEKLFKSALRFSFVERLFPEANKKNNLRNYYERLKISVPWLKSDPHFWLQYGMANIPFKEYARAQGFFDQSYALAEKKHGYHTNSIDTQQARLYLLVAMTDNSSTSSRDELFDKAHKLLSKVPNDFYKFRQVDLYSDYYSTRYQKLLPGGKVSFEHACKRMLKDIEIAESHGDVSLLTHGDVVRTREKLVKIVEEIAGARTKDLRSPGR